MMIMKTPYKVKCLACGIVNPLGMELECVSSYRRKMGLELEYMAVGEILCPNCGASIIAQIDAWEYPEGTVEHYIVMTDGAEKIEEPVFIPEM